MKKNSLIKKLRLISKFMTSQPRQPIVTIHIFSNISSSEGNQKMKLGQLREYNRGNLFLEKSYTKFCGDTSPDFFLFFTEGKSKWSAP